MTRTCKAFTGILVAGIMLAGVTPALATNKVGVVDIQQVFQNTTLGKAIQTHLKHFADRRVKKMKEEQKTLQDEQAQIRQQVGVISKDALKAKEIAFQKKVQDFQKRQQKVQTQIASESFVEFRKFLDAVSAATISLGKKYEFRVIIAQHPLRVPLGPYPPPFVSPRFLYIHPDADITRSVIKYVDEHVTQ